MDQSRETKSEEKVYKLALKRLNMKRDLFKQIVTYMVVNAFLAWIDYMYSDGTWFYYVLGVWGIVLVSNAIRTYSSLKFTHSNKAINKEIEKLK